MCRLADRCLLRCCTPVASLAVTTALLPPPQALEAARRVPLGVQELGEEDMGRLAAAAKAAGMEELFLTALKLAPAR